MNPHDKGLIPVPRYHSFDSLPAWAKSAILRFCSDNGKVWVTEPVPALDGQTFLEAINGPDGEARVRAYFNTVIGKFFPGDTL